MKRAAMNIPMVVETVWRMTPRKIKEDPIRIVHFLPMPSARNGTKGKPTTWPTEKIAFRRPRVAGEG